MGGRYHDGARVARRHRRLVALRLRRGREAWKMKQRKGVVWLWLTALFGMFIFSMLWMIFSVPFAKVLNVTGPLIQQTGNTEAYSVVGWVNLGWTYWPLIMMFGFIIYIITAGRGREPQEFGYG